MVVEIEKHASLSMSSLERSVLVKQLAHLVTNDQ